MSEQKHKWEQAVIDAVAQFGYGDTITMEWLHKAFGIKAFGWATRQQFMEAQWEYFEAMENFKKSMLKDHKKALRNVRGCGYQIIQPHEHAEAAQSHFNRLVKKAVKESGDLLKHTAFELLDQQQAQENSEAVANLAAFKMMSEGYLGKPSAPAAKIQQASHVPQKRRNGLVFLQ